MSVDSAGTASSSLSRGALWMLLSCGLMSLFGALVHYATAGIHPFQLAFLRSFFALLITAPLLLRGGWRDFTPALWKGYALRAGFGVIAMLCNFSALALTQLTTATALQFTTPLFVALGAAVVLRERVGVQRWGAAIAGFLGVLVVLRPGLQVIEPGTLLALAGALFTSLAALVIKRLSRSRPPMEMVAFMAFFFTLFCLPFALPVWRWPSPPFLLAAMALGALAVAGHFSWYRALSLADASAITPIDYLRLPISAAVGYMAFGEVTDGWIWAGGAIIAGSAIWLARHEIRCQRKITANE
ncbi:DMT family transporter [Radicibacter daui]|uniref:DMT family transporter n=1 Tax=Radicibacter daui TaxID=3064829 RepID=UPI004046F580